MLEAVKSPRLSSRKLKNAKQRKARRHFTEGTLSWHRIKGGLPKNALTQEVLQGWQVHNTLGHGTEKALIMTQRLKR